MNLRKNKPKFNTFSYLTDEHSAKICFHSPYKNLQLMSWSKLGELGGGQQQYQKIPQKGEMSVWPSWLEHEVKTQCEFSDPDRTRIAISWNLNF